MASSSYNVMLAAAALPDPSRSRQVVIGTADDVVFFGGAGVGANGASAAAAGVALPGGATLSLGATSGAPGVTGQVLTSGGAGVTPFWGNFTFTITPVANGAYTLGAPFAPLYVFDGAATSWSVALPNLAPGARFWLKNYAGAGSVTTAAVPVGGTTAIAGFVISTNSSTLFVCDGALWYIVASSAPPSAPAAPTAVSITSATQALMTVNWSAPVSWGSFVANAYSIRIYQGPTTGTPVAGARIDPLTTTYSLSPIGASFDFSNTTPFVAAVVAINSRGLTSDASVSAPYSLPNSGPPTGVTIVTNYSPISPTTSSMSVSWTAPVWGVQGAGTSYTVNIYQGPTSGTPVASTTVSTALTTATLSGVFNLNSPTAFTTTVSAVNGYGQAPVTGTSVGYSWAVTAGTVSIDTPASQFANSVTVRWSGFAPINSYAYISLYRVNVLLNGSPYSNTETYASDSTWEVGTNGFDFAQNLPLSATVEAVTLFSGASANSPVYNWGAVTITGFSAYNIQTDPFTRNCQTMYVTWSPPPFQGSNPATVTATASAPQLTPVTAQSGSLTDTITSGSLFIPGNSNLVSGYFIVSVLKEGSQRKTVWTISIVNNFNGAVATLTGYQF